MIVNYTVDNKAQVSEDFDNQRMEVVEWDDDAELDFEVDDPD